MKTENGPKVVVKNWDHNGTYEFGFGCGYYFAGKRHVTRRGKFVEVPHKHEKQISIFEKTLAQLAEVATKEGGGLPFFILDDYSPITLDSDRLADIIGKNPMLYVRLPKNIGCGGKENIIQHVLAERCKYVLRFDADIRFTSFSLAGIKHGFKVLPDAWSITPCITYFARLDASQLPADQRYFTGSNSADFLAYKASVLGIIGYSDPVLRYNDDGDHRLRALATLGLKCYVDRELTGKAPPSGAGANWDTRIACAKYVEKTRPFIKVIFPPNKTPRLSLNKKKLDTAKGFHVPAHPIAKRIASCVWS